MQLLTTNIQSTTNIITPTILKQNIYENIIIKGSTFHSIPLLCVLYVMLPHYLCFIFTAVTYTTLPGFVYTFLCSLK